ncbi:hypothetical protein [Streptomyces sp. NPDC001480]|uniref:hypothetical protein n=1 Tax=Streptomyces sp. NPDC001480 TaxID=3364577 RepID=UPI003688920D
MPGTSPATSTTTRICPNCDGFATAAISLGDRDDHGHLTTLPVDCPACHGTGTVPVGQRPTAVAGR